MRRRVFLRYAAGLPLLGVAGCKRRPAPPAPGPKCAPVSADATPAPLSPHERGTLEAVCARVLPTDEEPGATEAGVTAYIESQLQVPPANSFRHNFSVALKRIDGLARRQGRPFAELAPEAQDGVLRQFQRLRLSRTATGSHFMRVLVSLVLEGFLSDPVYGGNRNEAGWKVVRFEPMEPRPRCPYRGRG
ncbi:MAG: gluconate 2-dehydrogenase subunit 3 family protein [Deltaproteobacteria bacterium]|nr:gluconate 2-dehydrogenase subunit 3 family protein [Deltaproteobacteria bacterium]